jgi:hypothetical protein
MRFLSTSPEANSFRLGSKNEGNWDPGDTCIRPGTLHLSKKALVILTNPESVNTSQNHFGLAQTF